MEFYFNTPANKWLNGLPIGNGRLAAMVQETDLNDEITLNNEWIWGRGAVDRKAPHNAEYLPFVRDFFKKENYLYGAYLTNLFFAGTCGYKGVDGDRLNDYSMACEIDFSYICKENTFIERRLDITNGIVTIKRKIDDDIVKSEYFVDCVSDRFMFSWSSNSKFSGKLSLSRNPVWDAQEVRKQQDPNCILQPLVVTKNSLVLQGFLKPNVSFCNNVKFKTDGSVSILDNGVEITDATYIYVCANITAANSENVPECNFEIPTDFLNAKSSHMQKFSDIMSRVVFELGDKDTKLDVLTTDERVKLMKSGKDDNGVCEMYFNFGRYLMASSTICGELPPNLQGKWSNMIQPPWNADYHYDINIEMNYWAAESTNMSEGLDGFVKFANSLIPKGQENAKNLYGCRGILIPLSSDTDGGYYGVYGWTAWIGAAAWVAQHLWWHYIYSGNKEYLKNDAYNFFYQTALFYEDYLEKDENGVYQIIPSYSPENPIDCEGDLPVGICISASMDIQLAYDALTYAIESAKILNIDSDKVAVWTELRDNLPKYKIGTDGRLMEWNEEFKEREPGHRHLSHLYGIYPSDLFTPNRNIKEYEAAKKSYDYRLAQGGGHTGWSRAWCSCISARLMRAEQFYEHYIALIKDFASPTLLDLHPPGVFQIDGNLGSVAAVVESIIGYYDNTAHILPALPRQWNSGKLCGIKVPGGHIFDVCWQDGVLTELKVTIGFGKSVIVSYKGKEVTVLGEVGQIKNIHF